MIFPSRIAMTDTGNQHRTADPMCAGNVVETDSGGDDFCELRAWQRVSVCPVLGPPKKFRPSAARSPWGRKVVPAQQESDRIRQRCPLATWTVPPFFSEAVGNLRFSTEPRAHGGLTSTCARSRPGRAIGSGTGESGVAISIDRGL